MYVGINAVITELSGRKDAYDDMELDTCFETVVGALNKFKLTIQTITDGNNDFKRSRTDEGLQDRNYDSGQDTPPASP